MLLVRHERLLTPLHSTERGTKALIRPRIPSVDRAFFVPSSEFRASRSMMTDAVFQRCINADCAATCGVEETAFQCPRCGGLLDVAYDWDRVRPPKSLREFEAKWSERTNPLSFSGVLALSGTAAVRGSRTHSHHRRRSDHFAARRYCRRLCRGWMRASCFCNTRA